MADETVIPIDLNKLKGRRVGEVDLADLIDTLRRVIEQNLQPRLDAELKRAVEPLRAQLDQLRVSLQLVGDQVERVRLGSASDASLVVTDDPTAADVKLASATISHEERYVYSTVNIAERIPGKPSSQRVATVIDELGLKNDSRYWCELRVGQTIFNRYSKAALLRVQEAFGDPTKHLPADSPALRTVMNFLEGA